MELETAKEILAEVFHARPGEVEEMIREDGWREELARGARGRAVAGDVLSGGVGWIVKIMRIIHPPLSQSREDIPKQPSRGAVV